MTAPPQSLADRAHDRLTRDILTRRLAGGETLVEGRLAETMGVSRTPMREALSRLEGEGLLVRQGSGGFAVRQVSVREFFHALRVRMMLEPDAAAAAARSEAPPVHGIAALRAHRPPVRRRAPSLAALGRGRQPAPPGHDDGSADDGRSTKPLV